MLKRNMGSFPSNENCFYSLSFSILFLISAMQAGQISPLTYGPQGIPHQVPIQEALRESNKLEVPQSIQGKLNEHSINEETDEYMKKSWENAYDARAKAKASQRIYNNWLDKGWEYFKEIASLGILETKVDKVERLHRETREHYMTSLWSSKQLYKEIITDLHLTKLKLERIGADNYTGPAKQSYKKTIEMLNRLNKSKEYSYEKDDIASILAEISREIKIAERISPELYNLINSPYNSLVSKYSVFKELTERNILRMNKTLQKNREEHRRLLSQLEEEIIYLDNQDADKVDEEVFESFEGEIKHSELTGSPKRELRELIRIKENVKIQSKRAERIYENKENNYLSRSIKKYRRINNELKKGLETALNTKKRLKEIKQNYKRQIDIEKGDLKKSLLTEYRKEIKEKEERSRNQETIGKQINSLQDTLRYIKTIKELEEKDLAPIKQRISREINKVNKYIELGYQLEDKKLKLEKLKEIRDPILLPNIQRTLNEIKETIIIRVSPLEERIRLKEEKANDLLNSIQKITSTSYGERNLGINKNRLRELRNQYNRVKNTPCLDYPIEKLETYQKIIRETSPLIEEFKSAVIEENTNIEIKDQIKNNCNEEIIGEIKITAHNPLSVPLHNIYINKEISGDIELKGSPKRDELNLRINTVYPQETIEKTKRAKFTPFLCTEKESKRISITEERLTKQKQIEIKRNVENSKVYLNLDLCSKTEIIHKNPNLERINNKIVFKPIKEKEEIKLTYQRPPEIQVNEEKIIGKNGRVKHTMELINHEEKIYNFTLKRNIDPSKVIDSNYPVNEFSNNYESIHSLDMLEETHSMETEKTSIRIPKLKNHAKIKLIYIEEDFKKKAQDILVEIKFLNNTREVNHELEEEIKRIKDLQMNGEYEKIVEIAPNLINRLRRLPNEKTYSEEEKNYSEKNKSIEKPKEEKEFSEELKELEKELSDFCLIIDCKDIEKMKEKDEESVHQLEKSIKEIKEKINSRINENSKELDEVFNQLKKAFKDSSEFKIDDTHIPYTQEDLEYLKNRKKDMKGESKLIDRNINYLLDQKDPLKINEDIRREEKLIEDSKKLLSQMERSSIDRMQEVNDKTDEKDINLNYLEKAKNYHSNGEYLNSMIYSKKSIQQADEKGIKIPYKHIFGAFLILGTTLYFLKKPSEDNELDDESMKLKRGR